MDDKIDLSGAVKLMMQGTGCSRRVAKERIEEAFSSGKLTFEATNPEGKRVRIRMIDGAIQEQEIGQ